jgi:predicted RNase H-like HicB family nuclease
MAGPPEKIGKLECPTHLQESTVMSLERMKLKLTAVFGPAPEGGYTSQFEELPEVFSEGETLEESKANLLDALAQVMEYHRDEARKPAAPGALREEFQLAAS